MVAAVTTDAKMNKADTVAVVSVVKNTAVPKRVVMAVRRLVMMRGEVVVVEDTHLEDTEVVESAGRSMAGLRKAAMVALR